MSWTSHFPMTGRLNPADQADLDSLPQARRGRKLSAWDVLEGRAYPVEFKDGKQHKHPTARELLIERLYQRAKHVTTPDFSR
jgi:hypothetical protein